MPEGTVDIPALTSVDIFPQIKSSLDACQVQALDFATID
jgi:hypothetical protein